MSRDLQPAAAQLPRTLPLVNDALQAGVPAFRQTPQLGEDLEDLFVAAEDLGDNPSTLLALKDLRTAVKGHAPGARVRGAVPDGLQLPRLLLQPARHAPVGHRGRRHHRAHPRQAGGHAASRTRSAPPSPRSRSTADPNATPPQQSLHTQYGGPAIDSSGRADCQAGQTGYPNSLSTGDRWNAKHIVVDGDTPGLAGGTFKSRELGIDHLKDVP